jgi:phosphorylase kinase gamma subunit
MARDETDDTLPSQDVAKEFYAKYEPKEILGRCVHAYTINLLIRYFKNFLLRGVSSTVRRCVEKETGREYACKIMDINGDPSETEGPAMRESTLREIAILRRVAGHPYISKHF